MVGMTPLCRMCSGWDDTYIGCVVVGMTPLYRMCDGWDDTSI